MPQVKLQHLSLSPRPQLSLADIHRYRAAERDFLRTASHHFDREKTPTASSPNQVSAQKPFLQRAILLLRTPVLSSTLGMPRSFHPRAIAPSSRSIHPN